jgi:hypothetical protein
MRCIWLELSSLGTGWQREPIGVGSAMSRINSEILYQYVRLTKAAGKEFAKVHFGLSLGG